MLEEMRDKIRRLEAKVYDLKSELESSERRVSELESELEEKEEFEAKASILASSNDVIARFENPEVALLCLPYISLLLKQSLRLTSEHSLGIRNPFPEHCFSDGLGILHQYPLFGEYYR